MNNIILFTQLIFLSISSLSINRENKVSSNANYSIDKIKGYFDNDDLEDYIIRSEKNKLSYTIYINNGKGFDAKKKFTISEEDFDEVENALDNLFISNPKKGEIVIGSSCCASLKTTELNYYKFFDGINNWVLYKSSTSTIDSDFIPDIKTVILDFSYTIEGNKIATKTLKNQESLKLKINNTNKFNDLFNKYKLANNNSSVNNISEELNFDDLSEIILFIPISKDNIEKYNDFAYYLGLSKKGNNYSIFILKNIIKIYPTRTVAFLNLADSYYNVEEKNKAKTNYKKYISLMITQGKDLKKVPQRVYDRSK